MRILMLALYEPLSASTRVRLLQYRSGLEAYGHCIELNFLLPSNGVLRALSRKASLFNPFAFLRALSALAGAYVARIQSLLKSNYFDLIIVQCEVLPFFPAFLELFLLRAPFIYDFDDAFYLKYRLGRYFWLNPLLGSKFDRLMSAANAVTAGNSCLSAYAQVYNADVTLLPSVVDTSKLFQSPIAPHFPQSSTFTIGWIGSPSTAPYLRLLVEPLETLALERQIRVVIVGGTAPLIRGAEVIEVPWSLEQELAMIQDFDIGVMPLPDTPWARGKCAYKLIQCMACGLPVVASSVGANVDAVPPECGFLACSSEDWLQAFRCLAGDINLRRQMGLASRAWVVEHYSLLAAMPVLAKVINRVFSSKSNHVLRP